MLKAVRICLILPAAFLIAAHAAQAESIKVGQVDSGYCVPFGCSGGTTYQQVFDASLFSHVFDISVLDFFNTTDECCGEPYIDPAHYEVWISTTSAAVNGLNPTDFAANRGADSTRVFSGALGSATEPVVRPGPETTLRFSWTNPFHYDPRTGNLLIEVRKTGGYFFGDDGTYLDFDQFMVGSSHVADFFPGGYWNNRSAALVARFNGTFGEAISRDPGPDPVPEPTTFLLIGTGLAGAALRKRRRNRRALN